MSVPLLPPEPDSFSGPGLRSLSLIRSSPLSANEKAPRARGAAALIQAINAAHQEGDEQLACPKATSIPLAGATRVSVTRAAGQAMIFPQAQAQITIKITMTRP